MKILAIDLGKYSSVACLWNGSNDGAEYRTVPTRPAEIHDLLVEVSPEQVIIEIGPAAGWITDLAGALDIPIQVANTSHEAWRWRNVRVKTDRNDALKLAQLTAMGQLPVVHMPAPHVRQWRVLIAYRRTLVDRRTAIRNNIRAVLDRQGLRMPKGRRGWTQDSLAQLREQACEPEQAPADELWRAILAVELRQHEQACAELQSIEQRLDELGSAEQNVQRLRTIPGVGPRLAEIVVAIIDDPKRFQCGKQVAAYAGLVPRQYQSGDMNRMGHLTKRGPNLLRGLLVEVSWLALRYNAWAKAVFDRVGRGVKSRRKTAIVAVARRLLIRCWAMLRDQTEWIAEPTAATN
jgi:transposase